jgi:MFS family permease
LLAGALAQFAPDPLRLSYAVHLGLLVPAAVAVVLIPEPVEVEERRLSLRLQRLSVPREMRAIFVRAATASFAAFAVMGLFTAVEPAFLAELLKLSSHLLAGAIVFGLFFFSLLGQLALELIPARRALPLGCAVLVAGSGLLAAGTAANSLALFLAGMVVAGVGIGLCFRAGLAVVNDSSPATQRAEVASSFFVVSYVAISLPIVGIGIAAQAAGLRAAGIVFTGLVAAVALAVMASLARRS